tara:strand:+ start:841 stop:1455 length:615 start_codon:yes stop_codon:yes gene_type:complete
MNNIEIKSGIIILKELQNYIKNKKTINISNKGTGAGGLNTNKNGLPYEKLTDLKTEYNIIKEHKYFKTIKFINNEKIFNITKQSHLFKYMNNEINHDINKAHGCKNPDECYIDTINKKIFIIEKKFQQCRGSVCEKIQTSDFKKWQYSRTFPTYNVVYIYCLSDWFKINCKAELEYLKYKNVPVYWGNDLNYKKKIIKFIVNYK